MRWLMVGALILISILAFGEVTRLDFVNFDDDVYVTENPYVLKGIGLDQMRVALTDVSAGLWHPLTTVSHMIDVELYGMNPKGHHATSLMIHIANGVLLFLFLFRITGRRFPRQSAIAAALFLVHPLSVESVAWVSERKNVLSTLFWILTMWAYVRYTERPSSGRYGWTLAAFVLGLLAKPMLVSVPFVLLLLDFWPLARIRVERAEELRSLRKPILEKIPFFVLSLIVSVITYVVQMRHGSTVSGSSLGLWVRLENAVVSYVLYIGKIIWPADLAVFYPHPGKPPLWEFLLAALFLIYVSLLAVRAIRTAPYFTFGWFWYLITLVPVIGIVQVGGQSMADRYTYVPSIGLYVSAVWGASRFFLKQEYEKLWPAAALGVFFMALILCTRAQVRVWTNSVTLFEHALNVTHDNSIAHCNLGVALERENRMEEAIWHYSKALEIHPRYANAHNNLGAALAGRMELDKAIEHFSEAVKIKPNYAEAHYNFGVALAQKDKIDEAIREYSEALRIKPNHYKAHNNLGLALMKRGRVDEAGRQFLEALRINPDDAKAHYNLGLAMMNKDLPDEAITHFTEALRLAPDYAKAHRGMGAALERKGRTDEARRHYSEANRLQPDSAALPPTYKYK